MNYDITSKAMAITSLCDLLGLSEDDIFSFIKKHLVEDNIVTDASEVTGVNLVKEYNIDTSKISITDINVVSLHFTSNYDNSKSLLMFGLRDLKFALSNATPLNHFLKKHGIRFDIKNEIMIVDGDKFSIAYKGYDQENKITSIARKVYFDSQTSCFLSIGDISGYLGGVHKRPEILFNIDNAFSHKNLSNKWGEICKSYCIKFSTSIENYTHYTFEVDEYSSSVLLKMIDIALEIIIFFSKHTESFSYLKPTSVIAKESIISIDELE